MPLPVAHYHLPSGRCPTRDFIYSLDRIAQHKVGVTLATIESGVKDTRKLKKLSGAAGIWEVRVKLRHTQIRLLGGMHLQHLVLVHAFHKKEQRIRKEDLALARVRYSEYLVASQ